MTTDVLASTPHPRRTVGPAVLALVMGRARRSVGVAALALLLLQLVVRGWVGLRGYYYLDDFVFTGRAMEYAPFDPAYLFKPYNSHVMPGAYLWVWALTRTLPFSYAAVVLVNLVLQLALGALFYALLRRLFGHTPKILIPFAVFVLSPITLPATLWWAAALNQLPQQIAMVAVLLAHVRYLRTGRVRRAMLGPLAMAAGLAFSEKTLLVLPLLVALTVLFFTAGPVPGRIRHAFAAHMPVWTAYALLAGAFAAYYLTSVPSPTRALAQGQGIMKLVLESFGRGIVPGLLGGPWTWVKIGYAGALADPGPFACAVALVVGAAVVVGTTLAHRRAWMGWALALGYALVNLAVLAVSRATFIGPAIGDEYRYFTDVALVTALGLGLATIPLAGRWRAASVQLLVHRPQVQRWAEHPSVMELRASLPTPPTGALTAMVLGSLTASSLVSTIGYDQFWRVNPARPYVANARAGFAAAPADTVLADGYVPSDVAWALLGRYATVGKLFSPLRDAPRTLSTGPSAGSLAMLDATGHLRATTMSGLVAKRGPVKGCGWLVRPHDVTAVRLQRQTLMWGWTVRIGYISAGETSVRATIDGRSTTLPVHGGLGEVYFTADGAFDEIDLSVVGSPATVCTDDVTVGLPAPAEGGGPP